MKNKALIVVAIVFIAVMAAAAALYPALSERYAADGIAEKPRDEAVVQTDDSAAHDEEQDEPAASPDEPDDYDAEQNVAVVQTDDFTVYDEELNEVKLSDFFGKPIVVNFWATWCPPCRSELPAFNDAHEKYGDDVIFLMVNLTDGQTETVSGVRKFVSDNGYSFPVYYDADFDAANAYGVTAIPETLFINSDGSLYETRVGAINEAVLESYIGGITGAQGGSQG